MKKIIFNLILVSYLFLTSCTMSHVNSDFKNPPTKSFVQILQTTKIDSCVNKKDPLCPIGVYRQTGSGMAINLIAGQMTVLTAGHVCDTRPDPNKIDGVNQTVVVLDHTQTVHQAWPVLINHHNDTGSADLCLLWVPTLEVKKINFSYKEPVIGDELIYIGAPLGIYHPPTVPIFKGLYSGKISASSSMVTFPATGGSSGAAVLNKKNKIVGVVFAANPHLKSITLVTGYVPLKLFLQKAKSKLLKNINNTQP